MSDECCNCCYCQARTEERHEALKQQRKEADEAQFQRCLEIGMVHDRAEYDRIFGGRS